MASRRNVRYAQLPGDEDGEGYANVGGGRRDYDPRFDYTPKSFDRVPWRSIALAVFLLFLGCLLLLLTFFIFTGHMEGDSSQGYALLVLGILTFLPVSLKALTHFTIVATGFYETRIAYYSWRGAEDSKGLTQLCVREELESEFPRFYDYTELLRNQFLLHLAQEMDHSSNRFGNGVESILPNYKLGKTLGIGSFGKVKIAEHVVTGHKVAIKILNRRKIKNMEMEEKGNTCILRLSSFTDFNSDCKRQYEVIETPSDIYVVMEYVKSGELFDYIVEKGRLQEDEARNFFQQVISGKLYAGPEVDVWSCGVILYALLCGTLPFDDENIPNLFKKIKGGIYTLPSHLSSDARDLIPRMLIVDPVKRITIPEIRQHRWFQTHLPRYLAVSPPDTAEQAKKINEEIIQEVLNMGFDRNQVMESLRNRVQNDATVTYYLLLDNRFRVPSGYLESEFQETTDSGSNPMRPAEAAASPVGHWVPAHMDNYGLGARSQIPADRKWALGLQSHAHPREIMNEVLKALQELNVCWKKIGHYNMKCRWVPGFADGENTMDNNQLHFRDESSIVEDDCAMTSPTVIKFELQLYKAREEKYLLDIQRVNGPQFLFLDLCAAFLTELRVI
ncbi:unnamed protein product [Thlaspi arvense]|uniref:non-specific serine/threonine protein kinase n=1 Tax=Thlaspi arvense TaxID=13288 RepID=A0AAU9RLM7_THLAR|nr:unnamed protein product [Thlaspi arvense]